jgi:hypothetical protein
MGVDNEKGAVKLIRLGRAGLAYHVNGEIGAITQRQLLVDLANRVNALERREKERRKSERGETANP